jgi:hypothetical protein
MAYHNTSGTAANTADLLVRLKDFLVGTVGWSLHDDRSVDAEPSYVLASTGESGFEDIFIRFADDTAADRIAVRAYLYWDAVTHAGVKEAFHNSYSYIKTVDASAFLYWIYADKDHVFIVTKIVATYYGQYSGLIKRFWSGAAAVTQAAAGPGADITVQVNDASLFTVGLSYIIIDDTGIERVQVTAIDTISVPNTVTLANLVNAYAVGAKIGEDPQPVVVGHYQSPGSFYALNKFDGWASAAGQAGSCGAAHGNFHTAANPDQRYGLVTMFPWLVAHTTAAYKELRGELIEVYAIGSGAADSEDVLTLSGISYKIFNLSGPGWCAVKE